MEKGQLSWIGLRPARRAPVESVQQVRLLLGKGLEGDRYASSGGRRQVTLIMEEDLAAAAAELGLARIAPEQVRRNLLIRGFNLHRSRGTRLRIGDCILELSGACHPCARMEENLGPGGLKAMAGRGGVTAKVIQAGAIRVGDVLSLESEAHPDS